MKVTRNHIIFFVIFVFSLYFYLTYKEKFSVNPLTPSMKDHAKDLSKKYYLNDDSNIDSDDILNRYINKHLLSGETKVVTPDPTFVLNNDTLKALQFIELNELKLILKRIYQIETLPKKQ
jgi:hypothetical protein